MIKFLLITILIIVCNADINVYHRKRDTFMNRTSDLFEVYVKNESQALYWVPTSTDKVFNYTFEDYIQQEKESIKNLYSQLVLNLTSGNETRGVSLIPETQKDGDIRSTNHGANTCLGGCVRLNGFPVVSGLTVRLYALASSVSNLYNGRSRKAYPARMSYCWKKRDQVCVRWDHYFQDESDVTTDTMYQMAENCTNICAQINAGCDFRFKSPTALQYYCVRNNM